MREAAGLSQAVLARHTQYTQSVIAHVETGRRRPTAALASACDRVLGVFPLLTTVVEMDTREGDHMKRRALLASITTAIGVSGLSGPAALADIVRHGLLDSADATEDWDAVVEDYSRRMVIDPSVQYGQSLLAQLMIARQQNVDLGMTPDRLRAIAQLSQLYGLWLGNGGNVAGARGWHRTATLMADRSGDPAARVFVRGRALSRGVYEGYSVRETVAGVDQALSISRAPSLGSLEAYSALVSVHCLSGNLNAGRVAVRQMQEVADSLPEADKQAGARERTVSFRNYLEGRVGPRKAADKAWAEADSALRTVPVWHADAKVYYAISLVRSGDVADGVDLALSAGRAFGKGVRVIGVGLQDVLAVVPSGYRSTELDELRTYAASGPVPWAAHA
jgi:transcriptional regulator with XRE-family HTH domain